MLLGFAAFFMLPATPTNVQAQGQVKVRNFVGKVHPIRKIVRLDWWASEDSSLVSFLVEHSLDGVEFKQIGEVPALLTGEEGHIYEYWDVNAVLGLNYYRLTLLFADGSTQMVDPIRVDVGAPPIYSYPTFPSRPGSGIITPFNGDPDNAWTEARVTDLYGRPVAMTQNGDLQLPDDLPSGIYVFQAKFPSGWGATTFVITQTQ